jgi:hypothetical protein
MTEKERYELFLETPLANMLAANDGAVELLKRGFFTAPASTKHHGAYDGGLFDHSFAVMNFLVELSAKNDLKWTRPESPFLVGMFHDLCKIDNYRRAVYGKQLNQEWEHNPDCHIKGHGDKSVMLLSQFVTLTEEEILCIRYHMGAFVDKEEWRDYTAAIHKYPNVLWTHHADMLASHVLGV